MKKAVEKKSFFKRLSKKHHFFIGAGILAVMVVHFVIQTAFIQSEKLRLFESELQSEKTDFDEITVEEQKTFAPAIEINSEDFEIKSEDFEPQKISEVKTSKSDQTLSSREEKSVSVKNSVKQKAVRETKKETKAERLRRAEKILTGF